MRRLLLVDDDPGALFGLTAVFRRYRGEWEVLTATSAKAALDLMSQNPVDVVVTDMEMPETDGSQLLSEVQRLYPDTFRVLLTGEPSAEAARRAVPCAHQALSKAGGASQLEHKLAEICWLGDLVGDSSIRTIVGGLSALRSRPAMYDRLRSALADPRTDLLQVGRLIESDIAVVAKILQLVNSSFFGLARPVSDVGQAVSYLGQDTLEALVLSASLVSVQPARPVPGFDADALQAAAEERAARARAVAPKDLKETAFTAALLSDIGQIVFAHAAPDEFAEVLATARAEGISLYEAETARWGFGHGRAGAYLLGLWGLPLLVVHAVAYHHEPCGCEVCSVMKLVSEDTPDEGGVRTGALAH